MANVGNGVLRHIDDPSHAIIAAAAASGNTGTTWVSDATGSATDFVAAVAAGKGLHYFGVMDAVDNSLLEFAGNWLMFTAQEGHCAVECMIQFEDASEHSFNFSFNDTVEDGNLPIDLLTTTFTKTASTYCGFVFDGTDATNKDLHCVWVDDDSVGQSDANGSVDGKPVRMSGVKPTDGKWMFLRVELQDRGSGYGARATFLAVDHLGRRAEKTFNTSVDRDCPLCWHLAIENRTATGGDVFLRQCNWEQTIADM